VTRASIARRQGEEEMTEEKEERGFERAGAKMNWGFNLWIAQHWFFQNRC